MDAESVVPAVPRRVVLVEGVSDRTAVQTLAVRAGRDLAAEGIAVLAMGGATNVGHFVARYGPAGLGVPLAGLCDAGEEREFLVALRRAGFGADLDRGGLAGLGFFVCVADLEDELIRALGPVTLDTLAAHGDLGPFRTFTKQPAQRDRAFPAQLHRWIGSGSGRKDRYAEAFAEVLEPSQVPRPLDDLLNWI